MRYNLRYLELNLKLGEVQLAAAAPLEVKRAVPQVAAQVRHRFVPGRKDIRKKAPGTK